MEAKIIELNKQIEELSSSNAKLMRANRKLKLDHEKLMNEQTIELKQTLKMSIEQNIRLQRANKILKQDNQQKMEELNKIKQEEIWKMKRVGPEYEYLVQVIQMLYKQLLSDKPISCESNCCFTAEQTQDKHYCRPAIKSHPSGNMTILLENENRQLKESLSILMNDRDALYQLLKDKETDNETLKYELNVKDDIVKQLETDFEKMELEITSLQKEWFLNRSPDSSFSELHVFPSVPI